MRSSILTRFDALLALSIVVLLTLFPLGCVETDGSGGTATTTAVTGSAPEGGQTPDSGDSETTVGEGSAEQARRVAAGIAASVVEVRAVVSSSALSRQFASGGGVVYRADGIIVTNDHVIAGGGSNRRPSSRSCPKSRRGKPWWPSAPAPSTKT